MQAGDGSFPGAQHTVTMSGGEALVIETTSLAALALLRAGDHPGEVRKAVEWLNAHRSGFGNFGSTQATVLALEVMAAYAKDARRTESAGTIQLTVNGKRVDKISYEKGHQGAIELDIGKHLRPGKNVVELSHEGSPLPYSSVLTWTSELPAAHPPPRCASPLRSPSGPSSWARVFA